MAMGRSDNMGRIRSKDSAPEIAVRQLLRQLGFAGYRLHRRDLPGKPDVAFIGRKKVIFVHGCFWHGHDCPEGARRPKSNAGYWVPKIDGNAKRDAGHVADLGKKGWDVLTVWECELRDASALAARLSRFLSAGAAASPRP